MLDANDLLNSIKKAAIGAVDASDPTALVFGKVTSIAPLKINVEQKLTLSEKQLILTRNVTDFVTDITVDWASENESGGSGDSAFSSHSHGIIGRKEILVHNALVVDDEVVLVRMQGGQKHLVLDRVVKL